MDGVEEKLGSILANPEMMQKIMAMAQTLGAANSPAPAPAPEQPKPSAPGPMPELDLAAIGKLSGLMGKTNIDRDQRALLSALAPFLSRSRIQKLENAMRAAKMAGFAVTLLGKNGLQLPTGR